MTINGVDLELTQLTAGLNLKSLELTELAHKLLDEIQSRCMTEDTLIRIGEKTLALTAVRELLVEKVNQQKGIDAALIYGAFKAIDASAQSIQKTHLIVQLAEMEAIEGDASALLQ